MSPDNSFESGFERQVPNGTEALHNLDLSGADTSPASSGGEEPRVITGVVRYCRDEMVFNPQTGRLENPE